LSRDNQSINHELSHFWSVAEELAPLAPETSHSRQTTHAREDQHFKRELCHLTQDGCQQERQDQENN